jgi:putative ABC transport system substrate-binding protein
VFDATVVFDAMAMFNGAPILPRVRQVVAKSGIIAGRMAGGLMSYGLDLPAVFRRTAELVDKVLKDAKPADMPIEQPTKYELAINLRTAKVLSVTIPNSLLVRADEVIH